VVQLEEWRQMPTASFDGAISSFVLHYGVPSADLARLAGQLRPDARFAANYFKGNESSIDKLVAQLARFGLVLERSGSLPTTPETPNPLLVFVRRRRTCC
jgi:hypothetical protein